MITRNKFYYTSLIFLGLTLFCNTPKSYAIPAEQPKTKYDVDIYSQMLTGYIADQNLEIIPDGQLGIPETMIVLNENELNGVQCDTTDASSCDKIARVQYPQQNFREEDVPIKGQCQKVINRLDPNFETSTKGKCKFDQNKSYSKEFVGTDTSGVDDLTIPGWQSYNHMYTSAVKAGKKNVLSYGSHDLVLPANIQNQLKLSLLWRAFDTWANYQKDNNPKKEMPVGGINWKEKVIVEGEEIELIDIYNHKLPGYMKAPCYRSIWETELDPRQLTSGKLSKEEFDAELEKCAVSDLPPVPAHLQKSTWLAKSSYFYKLAKYNKEEWVKYFDATPLYPSHTNSPSMAIGSLVLALGGINDIAGKFNIALHDATLVDNFSARAAAEGKMVETAFLNNAATGKAILDALGKKLPLVSHYFEESRTDVSNMPTALVFGNGNTSATADMAESKETVTLYRALTTRQFGSVLDYPNRYYNPETNPAPRMPKASEIEYEKQDANAVYDKTTLIDSIKNAFSIGREIFLKVIPHVERQYMVGDSWTQAGRFLEKESVAILMPSTELSKEYLTKNNNINVVVGKDGTLIGSGERLSNSSKLANSAFLPCQSNYRSDFGNTPKMIADGTAINTCGKSTTTSSGGGSVCQIADNYGIPCCQLQGVMELETRSGENMGSDSCSTNHGTFNCCHGEACGPAQVLCGQYNAFAGKDKLDLCSDEGAAELLSRAMLLKLCQADGKCNTYDWDKMGSFVKKNYSIDDGDYTAAAYFYGISNGCHVTACSQYRWGAGNGYCDSVESFCKSGKILPENTSSEFCASCNEEIVRAGQSPIQCAP